MPARQALEAGYLTDEAEGVLVARHHLLVLAHRHDLLHGHHAVATCLVAALAAPVAQLAQHPGALLHALELLVLGVVRVAGARADVAAVQPKLARQAAAALGHVGEVLVRRHARAALRVVLAAQGEGGARLAVFAQGVQDGAPQLDAPAEHGHVAQAVQALLGARQRHAHAVGDGQEAHAVLRVAAHQRQDHDVILLPLVLIHHVNLKNKQQ